MRNAIHNLRLFACGILILSISQIPAVAFDKKQVDLRTRQKKSQKTKLHGCPNREKIKLQCTIAEMNKKRGLYTQAVKEYEKIIAFPGINNSDKLYVYGKIATLYWRSERNPDKLKETIEKMLSLGKTTRTLNVWLKRLAALRFPKTSYTAPENLEFAWGNILKQKKITAQDKAQAYSGLIEAKLKLGKAKEAKQIAETAKADKSISTETRFLAALVLIGLDSIERGKNVDPDVFEQSKNSLKPGRLDLYNALNGAAAALRCLEEGRIAQQYAKLAKDLVPLSKKTYLCRYMEKTPLGASGWLTSDLLVNPDFREKRFSNYSQKDAAALIADVNAERVISNKAKNKEYYLKNTSFYMAYDQYGWHIFILCGESKLKKMLLDGASLGALEMFFAPGADHAYYQWIVDLNDGKLSTFDWNSPCRFFRQAENYIKTEVINSAGKIGVRIFFPWEMVYDKLPFTSGKDWIFEIIRWSPAGGISWSGGKVHETGKWGKIKWQPPTSEQLLQIQKNLLRKAWSKYKRTRKELVDDYWASRDFGDPEFLRTVLSPEVKRLNKMGKTMENPDKLSNNDIRYLYSNAITDWMEFKYKVSELRRDYLERRLTTPSTENK